MSKESQQIEMHGNYEVEVDVTVFISTKATSEVVSMGQMQMWWK